MVLLKVSETVTHYIIHAQYTFNEKCTLLDQIKYVLTCLVGIEQMTTLGSKMEIQLVWNKIVEISMMMGLFLWHWGE